MNVLDVKTKALNMPQQCFFLPTFLPKIPIARTCSESLENVREVRRKSEGLSRLSVGRY